jgi:hypothetical protein
LSASPASRLLSGCALQALSCNDVTTFLKTHQQ